jgi:ribosome biogenesis GTPase
MSKNSDDTFQDSLNEKQYLQQLEKETRRKKLQSARKVLKRNRQPKQVRRKNWLADNGADWDELDYEQSERVMPLGEGERRRAMERIADRTAPVGTASTELSEPDVTGHRGLVLAVSQGLCRVQVGERLLLCSLRGTLSAGETGYTNIVAVGDEVLVREDGATGGVVEAVLPRRSVLARPDGQRSHLQQVIVANADQLLIVASWRQPAIWLELVDRYLIAAERYHLPAKICVNKIDLVEDEAEIQATLQPYRSLGYEVIQTSALTGQGIHQLRACLHQQITVLAGLSGVGKSSLLAASQPGLDLKVGPVSQFSGEGQHTTTQASLIRLNPHTAVVDTPGIREFGLSGLARPELARFYPELAAVATQCRFDNCAHLHEPDCAVKRAVQQGRISTVRYHNYQKIYATL